MGAQKFTIIAAPLAGGRNPRDALDQAALRANKLLQQKSAN